LVRDDPRARKLDNVHTRLLRRSNTANPRPNVRQRRTRRRSFPVPSAAAARPRFGSRRYPLPTTAWRTVRTISPRRRPLKARKAPGSAGPFVAAGQRGILEACPTRVQRRVPRRGQPQDTGAARTSGARQSSRPRSRNSRPMASKERPWKPWHERSGSLSRTSFAYSKPSSRSSLRSSTDMENGSSIVAAVGRGVGPGWDALGAARAEGPVWSTAGQTDMRGL
jgi:hypothetical protein